MIEFLLKNMSKPWWFALEKPINHQYGFRFQPDPVHAWHVRRPYVCRMRPDESVLLILIENIILLFSGKIGIQMIHQGLKNIQK